MKMLLAMLPTLVLVIFSQLATKWRVQALQAEAAANASGKLFTYLTDLWVLAAYAAAFLGGVFWIFVVERYAISLAFPVYIGITVVCVAIGGIFLFGESLAPLQYLAIALIVAGVTLAVQG
jgi:multidrug transporter EmrE-like cation transporter